MSPADQIRTTAAPQGALSGDQVDIWHIDLAQSDDVYDRLRPLLSPEEQARADRFVVPRAREHFTVARAALRTILAGYLDREAASLVFATNAYGKPALAAGDRALRFNLSHSGELALCAVTLGREIGVDVERIRTVRYDDAIVERKFAPDEGRVYQQVEPALRPLAFFQGWTRKEAYIKGLGMGLAKPLASFIVTLAPGTPARLLRDDEEPTAAGRWMMHDLPCREGYLAALAVEGVVTDIHHLLWRPPDQCPFGDGEAGPPRAVSG